MTMKIDDWKNQELNRLLLKKWGLLKEASPHTRATSAEIARRAPLAGDPAYKRGNAPCDKRGNHRPDWVANRKSDAFLAMHQGRCAEEATEAEEKLEERRKASWTEEGGLPRAEQDRQEQEEREKRRKRREKEEERSAKKEGLEEYGTVGQYASRGRESQEEREQREAEEILAAREEREKRSKKEGLEEDCPPAELPAQGMDAPESEALTADDITDLQNLLDKLSNTLADESGMELAGGEAPSEEEAPIVMRQEEEQLREIVRGVITRLREKKIVR